MVLDRIKEYIDSKGITIAAFERSVGMSNASFGKSLKNGGAIGSDKLENILLSYPDLSPSWLLTGEGPMLKTPSAEAQFAHTITPAGIDVNPIHQPRYTERKVENQTINLYDFEAAAGLRSLLDNRHANIIDTIRIPNLPKCDGAIHIVGDSMYPLLKAGDIVLYKEVPADIQNIFFGEMYLISYLIEDDDYVMVKYIKKSSQGAPFVTLASQNPHHADRDIDFRHVNALALIKASIRINSMV